ncbi:MAG TPA: AtpZ/AtpI family protein [Chitinophagales bacterium]|nr:AtpZ/AtpI family protein [Chitinophagales bacterium]HNB49671.1 AtpZ/AtpI family protein [Chitinophagales bacterium]HND82552.1 AtpZ/AtpI family protein [Chitinophagales bacterium]HNF51057.1 AtpZ/AtpI family protein [Chitinophagales bacterium]HNI32041.1 AtpZ/AtpI family protein [Chitinophagales bacterium]
MDKPTPTSNNKSDKKMSSWLVYSGMAFEMFAVMGIFSVIGFYLDTKMATSPFLLITFVLLGLFISFYHIYKQLK